MILQHLAQIGAQGRFHLAPSTQFSVSSHSLGPAAEEENRLDTKPVKGRLLGSFRLAVKKETLLPFDNSSTRAEHRKATEL